MINEMTMEIASGLIPEMIPELTGDKVEIGNPDGCPLRIPFQFLIQQDLSFSTSVKPAILHFTS